MSTTIEGTEKKSPFVLADDLLDRLVIAAHSDPAVVPLVDVYRRTRADYLECTAMVADELEHFGIGITV